MHKRNICILIVITFTTFANCLLNGFVGDDGFLIVNNPFYRSLSNIPKLISDDYLAGQDAILNNEFNKINSGSVAYRPVLSLSYFLDYAFWGENPFGYHLHNVLFHLINVVLVYFLIFFIFKESTTALLAGLFFAVHPLKSEAVCAIGYRADVLACLFVLLSFYFFIKSKKKLGMAFLLMHVFFFLALFTKESVVVYPAIIVCYDWLIEKRSFVHAMKGLFTRWGGIVLILIFYFMVYFKIFPNLSLNTARELSVSLPLKVVTIMSIFKHYIWMTIYPLGVKLLPPLYIPRIESVWSLETGSAFLTVLGFMALWIIVFKKNKQIAFLLLWFLLCFIPVSNLIVIANPMAYRFMYLPSIGLAGAVGYGFMYMKRNKPIFLKNKNLFNILVSGIFISCIMITIILNFNWRNNTRMALGMVRDFPNYPVGYLHAGLAYFNAGLIEKAEQMLTKAVELDLDDPRGHYLLGLCVMEDYERALRYFQECIEHYPNFVYAYVGAGRSQLLMGHYQEALNYLEKSIKLLPTWKAFAYIIQAHMLRGEEEKSLAVFYHTEGLKDNEKVFLKKIYQSAIENQDKLPFDYGI